MPKWIKLVFSVMAMTDDNYFVLASSHGKGLRTFSAGLLFLFVFIYSFKFSFAV